MSNAINGVGTIFAKIVDGVNVPIAEVKSISGPTMSREMINVTSLTSVNGYREFIPSFRDGGAVTLAMFFTYTGYVLMKIDFDSDTLMNYIMTLTDDTTIAFSGYVQDLPINVTFDDAVTSDLLIKVTGEVTIDEVTISAYLDSVNSHGWDTKISFNVLNTVGDTAILLQGQSSYYEVKLNGSSVVTTPVITELGNGAYEFEANGSLLSGTSYTIGIIAHDNIVNGGVPQWFTTKVF